MAYTTKQKNDVKDIIETYTNDYLDRYIQQDVINEAMSAMDNNKTEVQVADAAFDYLYEYNQGDAVTSNTLLSCISKDVMLIMRHDIIKTLK